MNGGLLAALAISLVSTLILEAGFFLLTGRRDKKDLQLVFLVNILTNPIVVLVYWLAVLYTGLNRVMVKAVLELSAIAIEGYCYRQYGNCFRRPYVFSIAANAVSFGMGALIQQFV